MRILPPLPVLLALVLRSSEDLSDARERAEFLLASVRRAPCDDISRLIRAFYPSVSWREADFIAAWIADAI
jgi:hypothetical protein